MNTTSRPGRRPTILAELLQCNSLGCSDTLQLAAYAPHILLVSVSYILHGVGFRIAYIIIPANIHKTRVEQPSS